jgi:hypothetical protein
MMNGSRWTVRILVALVFVVVPYALKHVGVVQNLSDGIYLATGIAVALYTVETFYLRREMVRQNELMVQPLLITRIERAAAFDESGLRREQLMIRNIGRGPGLFVRVRDVEITESAGVRTVHTPGTCVGDAPADVLDALVLWT